MHLPLKIIIMLILNWPMNTMFPSAGLESLWADKVGNGHQDSTSPRHQQPSPDTHNDISREERSEPVQWESGTQSLRWVWITFSGNLINTLFKCRSCPCSLYWKVLSSFPYYLHIFLNTLWLVCAFKSAYFCLVLCYFD